MSVPLDYDDQVTDPAVTLDDDDDGPLFPHATDGASGCFLAVWIGLFMVGCVMSSYALGWAIGKLVTIALAAWH